jgi:cytochrome P450
MKEMVDAKKLAVQSGAGEPSTTDLIGQLVKGQEERKDGKSQGLAALSETEVMGNLFIFVIAGHETSANSIHFALVLLALHLEVQRKVQEELEQIFQGRPISEWEYDCDLPRLLNGMLGAVLNEELRLIAPTIAVPKISCPMPQQLTVNGKEVTVPANTMLRLCVPSVHRNPKFWPHGPPKDPEKPYFPLDNLDNDLEEFKPERWTKTKNKTADGLYNPVKGSYIPFSEGPRACLGRRFAQVEILAALAVILTEYSVELAVDEWASDEEVERMGKEQKRDIWKKAEEKAHWTWQNKMGCIITLQLRGGAHIPMRFVRKGEERFLDFV